MSTNAVVGYKDDNGNFRGTYVHWDGDSVRDCLLDVYGQNREALVEWVEAGIKGGGHSSYDSGPYDEDEFVWTMEKAQEVMHIEYVWQILKNGSIVKRKGR